LYSCFFFLKRGKAGELHWMMALKLHWADQLQIAEIDEE
jgi:hypothetical protein